MPKCTLFVDESGEDEVGMIRNLIIIKDKQGILNEQ